MRYRTLILQMMIATIMLTVACNSPKNEAKKIVTEWMGKEIILPNHNVTWKIMGRDTMCSEIWNKPHKVFVYIDSIGCISCRLGLPQWKAIIDTCRTAYPDLGFLFVVHAMSYKKFESDLRDAELEYPIIYDYHDEFYKLNQFPPDPYRTYLLDKDNKVILIGSPVRNPKIWELYKTAIVERR